MDREFWREYGVLIVFGGIGLIATAILLSYTTETPLLPEIDYQASIPGLVAIAKSAIVAAAIIGATILLCVGLLPLRDYFLKMEQKRLARRAVEGSKPHYKINSYRNGTSGDRSQQLAPSEVRQLQQAEQEYHALSQGLRRLLVQHGSHHKGTTPGAMVDALATLLQERVVEPPESAPVAANWRDIAALVEWARQTPKLGLRAARDAFRANGVQVPDADVAKGGAFNEWIKSLAQEHPFPTDSAPSVDEEKQAADGGRTADGRESEPRTEESVGKGRPQGARYVVPRAKRRKDA